MKINIFTGLEDRVRETIKSNVPELVTVWIIMTFILGSITDVPLNALSILLFIFSAAVITAVMAVLVTIRNHIVKQLEEELEKRKKSKQ